MKVSLLSPDGEVSNDNLAIRINIPGLALQVVSIKHFKLFKAIEGPSSLNFIAFHSNSIRI